MDYKALWEDVKKYFRKETRMLTEKKLKDHGIISLDSIKRRFLKVPARTLRYDLKKLEEKGFIIKIGSTRGAMYKRVIK